MKLLSLGISRAVLNLDQQASHSHTHISEFLEKVVLETTPAKTGEHTRKPLNLLEKISLITYQFRFQSELGRHLARLHRTQDEINLDTAKRTAAKLENLNKEEDRSESSKTQSHNPKDL